MNSMYAAVNCSMLAAEAAIFSSRDKTAPRNRAERVAQCEPHLVIGVLKLNLGDFGGEVGLRSACAPSRW